MSLPRGLTPDDVEVLASDADDSSAVETLLRAQDGRRRLLLCALLDRVDGAFPGARRAARADVAYDFLASTEEAEPGIVRDLLLLPSTGRWLVETIRSLDRDPVDGDALVERLCYLHTLAAVAAVRTGMDFDATLPVHAGRVVLPGLGSACVTDGSGKDLARVLVRDGQATIVSGQTSVQIGGSGAWRPVPVLTSGSGAQKLTIVLDDVDRYRDCYGLSPAPPLPDHEVGRWHRHLTEAWDILTGHHIALARGIQAGFRSIVPLERTVNKGVSCTSSDAFGSAGISLPERSVDLAVAMAHEFQHSKLGALMQMAALHNKDGKSYYAPWRDDPRPLGGLLQGCYAYFGVTAFWREQRSLECDDRGHFEFARWSEQTWRTTNVLLDTGALTPVGQRFVCSLRRCLDGWRSEPVAPDIARLARLASLDHWFSWRLRNMAPEQGWAAASADAWRAGRPAPTKPARLSRTHAAFAPSPATGRTRLLQRRLRDLPALEAPLGSAADDALVAGDIRGAIQGYEQTIRDGCTSREPWAGLAVALMLEGKADEAGALTRCPEVLAAVYDEVTANTDDPPPPGVLAQWLGDHVSGGSMSNSALSS